METENVTGQVPSIVSEEPVAKSPPENTSSVPEPMEVDEQQSRGTQNIDNKVTETEVQPEKETAEHTLTNGSAPPEGTLDQSEKNLQESTEDQGDNMIVDSQESSTSVPPHPSEDSIPEQTDTVPPVAESSTDNTSLPKDSIPDDVPVPSDSVAASDTPETGSEASNNLAGEAQSTNGSGSQKSDADMTPITAEGTDGESQGTSDLVNNCYCGQKRVLGAVELQCAGCYKWFHEKCISIPLGKVLPFMTYYTYFCKLCNPSGAETFSKKQPNFSQMCVTAVANLTFKSQTENEPKVMFSKDKEIIPYIETNWELLTTMPRRVKQTWHSTVYKSMMKDNDVFLWDEKKNDEPNSGLYPIFGLANQDLTKIAPSYDSMAKSGLQKQIQELSQSGSFSGGKGRSAKRRFFGDGPLSAGGKKIKSDLVMPKLPPNGYPLEHPFNKDGYRYILAEPDPHAPFRQEFDESQDWAGKPIPGWLYRKLTPNNVLLALHDRAPQLKVSEDRLSVTGEKGYCMIRATHGISRGTWYFEINIEEMSDGSATRLGWSQGLGNLQAPLGYDKFSYSWRSRKGTKFHESRGYHYADEGYGQGDTLGFLIELPPTTETIPLPPIFKDKPLVKFKSYLYYEEKDETQLELKRLKPLKGSKITFFKNGKSYGTAFENIYGGIYYPAASLYKNCLISFNFGPDFKYPPEMQFKGMHEAALESLVEQMMTDLLFFTENKGKLRLDNI